MLTSTDEELEIGCFESEYYIMFKHEMKLFEEKFEDFFGHKSSYFSELFLTSSVFDLERVSYSNIDRLPFVAYQPKYISNYFDEMKIVRLVGNDIDQEKCNVFENSYDSYVLNVAHNHRTQIVEDGHLLVTFVLDGVLEGNSIIQFNSEIISNFSLPPKQIQVTKLYQLNVITMQIPEDYISNLTFTPLYANKIALLKDKRVEFFMFKKHELILTKWNVFQNTDFIFGEAIFCNETGKIITVYFQTHKYFAIEVFRKIGSKSAEDEEFIEYIKCLLNYYHENLPDVKGLIYPQEHLKLQYPLLLTEGYEPLCNIASHTPVEEKYQISFLLDIIKCITRFKQINTSISIKVDSRVLFFRKRGNNFEPKLFPLYGFNFTFNQSHVKGQLKSLPLEDLAWMMDVTKFLYFGANSEQVLPENHLLKKLLQQQWLSCEDHYRPTSFKQLSEDLQDLQGNFPT